MFTRKDNSYTYNDDMLEAISKDEASPLNRIANLIKDGNKVLDVGAGNGLLGRYIKYTKKNIVIDGIEPNQFAANIAKTEYRKFYVGYVQDFLAEMLEEKYDYIVFADVIEHIQDPIVSLGSFFSQLPEGTKIVISTPNIAFGSIRLSLMNGNFQYVDSGILEKTHLRFYTKSTLLALVGELNLKVETFSYLMRNFNRTEIDLSQIKINPFLLNLVSKDELSHVYQFLIVLSTGGILKSNKEFDEILCYGKKIKYPILDYYLKPLISKNATLKNFVKKFFK